MIIPIIGDIDYDTYSLFNEHLTELEESLPQATEIAVHLTSGGGDAMTALAFFDRIRLSPLNISILVIGHCHSAAVLILAAGVKRAMTPSSWVMVHDETPSEDDTQGKRVAQLEKNMADYRRIEDQWNQLLASVTKASAETWQHLHENETWLTPQQCLDLGLIEEIYVNNR